MGLKNYSGNPLEATIGPLIADEKIQKKINGIFEEGRTRFLVKLEKITPMIEGIDIELPSECALILDKVKCIDKLKRKIKIMGKKNQKTIQNNPFYKVF